MTRASGIDGRKSEHRWQLRGARDPRGGFLALNPTKAGFEPLEVPDGHVTACGCWLVIFLTVRGSKLRRRIQLRIMPEIRPFTLCAHVVLRARKASRAAVILREASFRTLARSPGGVRRAKVPAVALDCGTFQVDTFGRVVRYRTESINEVSSRNTQSLTLPCCIPTKLFSCLRLLVEARFCCGTR